MLGNNLTAYKEEKQLTKKIYAIMSEKTFAFKKTKK